MNRIFHISIALSLLLTGCTHRFEDTSAAAAEETSAEVTSVSFAQRESLPPFTEEPVLSVTSDTQTAPNVYRYEGNYFDLSVEFTGAEESENYPALQGQFYYGEDKSILHAKVTVTNKRKKSLRWGRDMTLYGDYNGNRGAMIAVWTEGCGLPVPPEEQVIEGGEVLSYDTAFMGDNVCLRYASGMAVMYSTRTEGKLEILQLDDRFAVKNAVRCAVPEETDTLSYPPLIPAEGENAVETENVSYCISAEKFYGEESYVAVHIRMQSLDGQPAELAERGFHLMNGDGSITDAYCFGLDTAKVSYSPQETEIVCGGETVTAYRYFVLLSAEEEGKAEFTVYFPIDPDKRIDLFYYEWFGVAFSCPFEPR